MSPPFRIINSDEGVEPKLLAEEFKHKPPLTALSPQFLDQAPDGYSSALCFFAAEAFLYYIAAYMVADLNDELEMAGVVFALTHGLDDKTGFALVNPSRFGKQRWIDVNRTKFAMFDFNQVSCIISYLEIKAENDSYARTSIEESLANYWHPRLDELGMEESDGS